MYSLYIAPANTPVRLPRNEFGSMPARSIARSRLRTWLRSAVARLRYSRSCSSFAIRASPDRRVVDQREHLLVGGRVEIGHVIRGTGSVVVPGDQRLQADQDPGPGVVVL